MTYSASIGRSLGLARILASRSLAGERVSRKKFRSLSVIPTHGGFLDFEGLIRFSTTVL